MSHIVVLGTLKFLGLGIGLASAIWSMVRRTTEDGPDGRKQLTPEGRVAIYLAIGSFFVAGLSYGFETIAQQNKAWEDKATAAADKEAAERREALNEQRALRLLEQQRVNIAVNRATAAEARADAANQRILAESLANRQRILTLTAADRERIRDLRLARDVYKGAQANLNRTGLALTQLERVLQPIGDLHIQVLWELPGSDPIVAAATMRLAELARQVRADRTLASRLPPGISLGGRDLAINVRSEFYPTPESNGVLAGATRSPRANVSIFVEASARQGLLTIAQTPPSSFSPLVRRGDLNFTLSASEHPTLNYNIDTGSLWFEAELPRRPRIGRSGELFSILDLERGTLAIDRADGTRPAAGLAGQIQALRAVMRPILVRIDALTAGRTYEIPFSRIQTLRTATGSPVFFAGPIGRPRN